MIVFPPLIVVGLVVVTFMVLVPWVIGRQDSRTDRLQAEYGERYFRATTELGNEQGEHILIEREDDEAHESRRDLSDDEVARYVAEWDQIRGNFHDAPAPSVKAADELVASLLARRGLLDETGGPASATSHVAVRFREAHAAAAGYGRHKADLGELKHAMYEYEAVFDEVI
jgi:hypothetical protein